MNLIAKSILICACLFFVQCKNNSDVSPMDVEASSEEGFPAEASVNGTDLTEESSRVKNPIKSKPTKVSATDFKLDLEKTYVPNVETCIYIRSSPEISNSNIIQCLIPQQSGENISGMRHELRSTGKTEGDWAEFKYAFDIYTQKPDPQDEVNFLEWKKNQKATHDKAKSKYRAVRDSGWLKYRNDDGTLNIVIMEDGG